MKRETKRPVISKVLHLSLKKWPCFLIDKTHSYVVTPRSQVLISKSGLTIEQLLPRQNFKAIQVKDSSLTSQQQNYPSQQHTQIRRINMLNILQQMWRQIYQKQSKTGFSKIKKSKTQRKINPPNVSEPYQTIQYQEDKLIKKKCKPSKPSKQRLESRLTDYDSTKSRNTNREVRLVSKLSSPKLTNQVEKKRHNKQLNQNSQQCTKLRDRLLKLMIEWNKYEQKYHQNSSNSWSRITQKQHKLVKESFIKESTQLEKKLHFFCPNNKLN